tara:strand:+ start:534 stop:698 length:165 start_codon:yes stop_codon:yes gene_type:complete
MSEEIDEIITIRGSHLNTYRNLTDKLVSLVCWLGENHLEVLKEYNKYTEDKESD